MFKGIRDAWKESRGNMLFDQAHETLILLNQCDLRVAIEFIINLSTAHERLLARLYSLSPEGRLQLGKALQTKARGVYDFDLANGYSMWLQGAWLELGQLPGPKAKRASEALGSFIDSISSMEDDPSGYSEAVETALNRLTEASPDLELNAEQILHKVSRLK